jgi:C-methyltransferase C-terminal domain/Putative zinc binding domain/Methyltransferase domain
MSRYQCRACRGQDGHRVLDLGEQPASDSFPRWDDPGPDPVYPLRMWLCSQCGLAQLMEDPTVPEEPKGAEPAALVEQAADAVRRVRAAGLLPPGARVAEYGSPHGGSWLGLLTRQGARPVSPPAEADVIIDCFGMMHAADQAAALGERAARLAPGGTLLMQYHSLNTVVRLGQWNALRHGHYAYYSTTALTRMLAQAGLVPRRAWQFELYGGTVLLAASRGGPDEVHEADESVRDLLEAEASTGVLDPDVVAGLQHDVQARARGVHGWLAAERAAGRSVLGYGAASRAVALLRKAEVDHSLLAAVADASPAKQGLRMPGSGIPVISPREMVERQPDAVLLFVADLMAEVRTAYPQIEAANGRWVIADELGTASAGHQPHFT